VRADFRRLDNGLDVAETALGRLLFVGSGLIQDERWANPKNQREEGCAVGAGPWHARRSLIPPFPRAKTGRHYSASLLGGREPDEASCL